MKTQRNLLLFPAIVALVYGLASVFIPRSFITYFDIPAEMITPGFVAWVVSTGIVSIGLSMLAFWMRSLTDASSMKGGMTVFSIFYALFTVIQGIVSILLAIVFFAYREPKEETK